MKYVVTIQEILEREIPVEANSQEDAQRVVEEQYKKQLHILDADDFAGLVYSVRKE